MPLVKDAKAKIAERAMAQLVVGFMLGVGDSNE